MIPGVLPQMLELIRHRGPDDDGEYGDEHIQLGMVRLSIIDLQGGHQPISNHDGTVWAVFNGEIFNYIELRREWRKRLPL
jgi:asparagine synthase (glutamine-hydrolysing)